MSDPIRIRFTILNGYAQELHDLSVSIRKAADGGQPNKRELESPREFTVPNPHENFQICTTLPEGWFVVKAPDKRCLDYEATGEDVEILLSRQGS